VLAAPPATEVEPQPANWIGYTRSPTYAPPHPRRLLGAIETLAGEVYLYGGGTATINEWVPVETNLLVLETVNNRLLDNYRAVDFFRRSNEGLITVEIKLSNVRSNAVVVEEEQDASIALPESALIAKEVRDLSGLSAERLGEIFPVERESFQRWLSGRTTPSPANLERLLTLRHFLRELANRVESAQSWLLTPLVEGTSSATPHEMLKAGNVADLWDAVADLPSKARRYTQRAADGSLLTVTEGSLRGRDNRTNEEELDDYDEWLSEDE
jgi:transcriptional regulator with XRE-family HTH domain